MKAEEIEQEELEEEQGADEAAVEVTQPEIEDEDYRLSLRQKIWVVAGLLLSFVFFTALLFPREIVLRMVLSKFAGQVRINFSSADPGLLG